MDFKFNVVDAIKVFGRFGLIKHMDKIDVGDISNVVLVKETVSGSYNVYIMPTTSSGRVIKNEFADCFLVTAKKIYRQQDFPGAEMMEALNKYYVNYMTRTYPEYALAKSRHAIKVDLDAENFYGEQHYSC